ncbi:MAG: hypothetical protein JWM85_1480 [Acidimicrobiaceae bacterium]|nr:hypothetical protein [Acidimicrobiaceae bacterium]
MTFTPSAPATGAGSAEHPRAAQRRTVTPTGWLDRIEGIKPWRFAVFCVVVYAVLALFAYLPTWPGDPNRIIGGVGGDAVQDTWFLDWVPWAVLHSHNPFLTTRMYYPVGANLAINTEMPLLGLITAPLSFAVSPVASFNLLMWAAFPASAASMFFVVRRLTRSNLVAATGGLLYGFSSYVAGEALGHLNLSFVPFPPLLVLCLFEVFIAQRASPRRWGVALGLVCVAQFFISPEVLFTTGIAALCALVIVGIARWRAIDRQHVLYALTALIPAVAILAVFVGYPVYLMVAGPLRFHGPVQGITNPYRADLLGPVVPTAGERFAPSAATTLGTRFTGGVYAENGSYLGIPLLLLTIWALVRYRANRWILLCGGTALAMFVLSLGPYLTVDTNLTSVPLPFNVIARIPLFYNALPSRLSLFVTLFVTLLLCLALNEAITSRRGRPSSIEASTHSRPQTIGARARVAGGVGAAVLAVASLIALVPRWPIGSVPISNGVPAFFTGNDVKKIPYGVPVLTFPFSVSPANEAMLWQALDRMRFSLIGGYALGPKPDGSVSPWPPQLMPLDVQAFLGYQEMPMGYLSDTPIPVDGRLIRDIQTYLVRHGVKVVLISSVPFDDARVLGALSRALGPPSATEGGVSLWLDADQLAKAHSPGDVAHLPR